MFPRFSVKNCTEGRLRVRVEYVIDVIVNADEEEVVYRERKGFFVEPKEVRVTVYGVEG